ncbi:MAG: DUF916 domain-containing protein [Actinobacteria bacterium]|nr:DUF916 domain-containing protein [Actinomycetota bacterium]
MITRRHLTSWAATVVVAFLASALPASGVSATTVPPTDASVPTDSTVPADPNDPSNPQIIESWTLSPAVPEETPDAGNRPNLSYFLNPGETIKDKVTVYNFGNVAENFQIYATDAFNDEAGNFAALEADEPPVDVGTWVEFAQSGVTVQPGQQVTIPIVIKVPVDAAPGDHVGAILASSPTIGTGESGQVITLDRRTGTNLLVRVNGELNPELAVTNVDTSYHHSVNSFGGSATVSFRIENRGNIRLAGTPVISVGGPFGLLSETLTLPDIAELLPGEELELTAELSGVPALVLNSTEVKVVPIGADGAETASASATTFAPPLALLLVVLAGVLFLLAMRARRRRVQASVTPSPRSDRGADTEPVLQHQ